MTLPRSSVAPRSSASTSFPITLPSSPCGSVTRAPAISVSFAVEAHLHSLLSSPTVASAPITLSVTLPSDPPSLLPTPSSPYPPCCAPALASSSSTDFWTITASQVARQQNASRSTAIETKSVANRNPAKGLNEDRSGVWVDDAGGSEDGRGAWCMAVCDGHGGSECAE